MASGAAFAQPAFSVTSYTDGNGLYTYTFDLTPNPEYAWRATGLYMRSYGILSLTAPAGWSSEFDSFGNITWSATNAAVFGEPALTFSVLSSITESTTYNIPFGGDPYPRGTALGAELTYPSHVFLGGGYYTFEYTGPVIPEPSSFAVLGLGLAVFGMLGRKAGAPGRRKP